MKLSPGEKSPGLFLLMVSVNSVAFAMDAVQLYENSSAFSVQYKKRRYLSCGLSLSWQLLSLCW